MVVIFIAFQIPGRIGILVWPGPIPSTSGESRHRSSPGREATLICITHKSILPPYISRQSVALSQCHNLQETHAHPKLKEMETDPCQKISHPHLSRERKT